MRAEQAQVLLLMHGLPLAKVQMFSCPSVAELCSEAIGQLSSDDNSLAYALAAAVRGSQHRRLMELLQEALGITAAASLRVCLMNLGSARHLRTMRAARACARLLDE